MASVYTLYIAVSYKVKLRFRATLWL